MQHEPIHQMFSSTADAFASRIAMEAAGRRVSYRTLEEQSNRLASFLLASGSEKGFIAGIHAESVVEIVIAMLGVLKAGGVFVILDPALPNARLETMAAAVSPTWLLTESRLLGRLQGMAGGMAAARILCLDTREAARVEAAGAWAQELAGHDDLRPVPVVSAPDDMCYVYFTSGSTGRPKGIAGRLKAIDHFIRWEIESFGIRPGARISQLTAPSFDAFLRDVFVPLCAGGTSCQPEKAMILEAQKLIDWIDVEGINLIHCVPSVFRTLVNGELNPQYFGELRHILLSGEPLLPVDVKRWMTVFGDRVQLVNLYGPTETTMTKFFYLVRPEDQDRRSIPIGKPMPGARAALMDRAGKPVPAKALGEIYIRTPFGTLGYFDDPEQTSRAFLKGPSGAAENEIVYRTGDLARLLEDGNFELLGRTDQQVKIRGVRIELPEIENALRQHPAVVDVAVTDREDGTGTKFLCAYVVLSEPVGTAALKEFLLGLLPEAMVPALFMVLKELPRTGTGKVDRKALPDPGNNDVGPDEPDQGVRSQTAELLAGIWSSLLGIEKVGSRQSFFEIGGHSLLATQLLSRIRSVFAVELPLRRLFDAPTLAGLAASVEEARSGERGLTVPPIVPVPRDLPLALSFAQERLWLIDRLTPGNPSYNIPEVVRIRGPLDISAVHRGLETIVERHEALRTSFPMLDGRPVQAISPDARVALPVWDVAALPEPERESELLRLARDEVRRPFDLAHGPLLRARLVRSAPEDHLLVLTMHHLTSDDWSRGTLIREWTELYTALTSGRPPALPKLDVQLADYAAWQRQWMSGPVLEEALAYWTERLAGLRPLTLPTDRPRPAVMTFHGATAEALLPHRLGKDLLALGHRHGATLFMILMAAFQSLVSRYTHREDVVVGTPIAGRDRAEIENLIGFFVNTLIFRADLSGEPSFRELLVQVRQTALEAFARQDVPFEKIVEALQPERTASHSPIFQIVFAFQNAPTQRLELPGLRLEFPPVDTATVRADLELDMADTGEGLVAILRYNTSLFDAATVRRLLRHLQVVLEGAVADPERRLSALPLMSPAECHQLLVEWNDTAVAREPVCLHRLFEAEVRRRPAAIAAVFEGRQITYDALNRRANQLARHLLRLGVGPEVAVGLCTDRSFDMLVGIFGILKAGGVWVPLDAAYPMERLSLMIAEAGVSVLLTQEELSGLLPMHWGPLLCLDTEWPAVAAHGDEDLASTADSENLAYVIFTSGSTGQPKGVLVPHRGLRNFNESQRAAFGFGGGDRVLQFASPSFDACISDVIMALCVGASLCLGARDTLLPGPGLNQLLREAEVTAVTLPPSTLAVLPPAELPALRTITVAGEACSRKLVDLWGPGRRFINLYGPTETTIWASAAELTVDDRREPAIGRPIANARLLLLSPRLEPVPIGVAGELHIGGVGVSRGYLNRPDLTAERFIPDSWSGEAGSRLYKTGDLARHRPDGSLEFLGRIDQQVKVRGFRIEPHEIEVSLLRLPGVDEAVVVAREDRPGERRLVAYVVLRDGSASVEDLRELLAQQLPAYMVPAPIVRVAALPRLPGGKVDRAALGAPDRAGFGTAKTFTPAAGPIEQVLAGIWGEVLGLERVGADESFFDLGGHSLAATQVLSRIRDIFHLDVPLRHLFAAPTIAALRQEIEAMRRDPVLQQEPPLVPFARDGRSLPLSQAQRQAWQTLQREPGEDTDHVPAAFRLTGALDEQALRDALTEIVRRHEALRTSFPLVDGEPVQQICPPAPFELPIVDLGPVPAGSLQIAGLLDEEIRRPFDLAHGPLLRGALFRIASEEHILLLVCHHLVVDQWSAGVFTRELSQLYAAFTAGHPSPLPELALQYADFALWEQRSLTGEALQAKLAYWRGQLAGALPLELAPNRVRPTPGTWASDMRAFSLPAELGNALRALGREQGATLFMAVLAAFKLQLAAITRQDDVVVRAPVASRTRTAIEPLIGFFPHDLILRTDLSGDPSYLDLLARVREVTVEASMHQDVSFETVAEKLGRPLPDELLNVTCNYYSAPMQPLELAGLALAPEPVQVGSMRSHLMLLLTEGPEGLTCGFHYRRDLFDPLTIHRMASGFRELLEAIASDPHQRLSALKERLRSGPDRLGDWPDVQSRAQAAEYGGTELASESHAG